MTTRSDHIVTITADSSSAQKSMDALTSSINDLNSNLKKTSEEAKNSGQEMEDSFAEGILKANIAVAAGTKALEFLKDAVMSGVQAAAEFERTNIELTAALQGSGHEVENNLQALNRQSGELERVAGISDEVIRRFQAMAINMGVTADKSDDLIKAAIRLSNVTGMQLESAMRNLIKTTGGLAGELGEAVPFIRELSKEQLKNGDAIRIVNERWQDQLGLLNQGISGKVNRLGNAFGSLAEQVIIAATEGDAIGDILDFWSGAFERMTDTMQKDGIIQAFRDFGLSIFMTTGEIKKMDEAMQDMLLTVNEIASMDPSDGFWTIVDIFATGGENLSDEQLNRFRRAGVGESPQPTAANDDRPTGTNTTRTSRRLRLGFDVGSIGSLRTPESVRAGEFQLQSMFDQEPEEHAVEALFRSRAEAREKADEEARKRREENERKHLLNIEEMEREAHDRRIAQNQAFGEAIADISSTLATNLIDAAIASAEGQEVAFEQVIKSTLRSLGTQMVAQGIKDVATGISRVATSYGSDATGYALIQGGGVAIAAGGAMIGGSLIIPSAAEPETGGGDTGGLAGGVAGAGGTPLLPDDARPDNGDRDITINVFGAATKEAGRWARESLAAAAAGGV